MATRAQLEQYAKNPNVRKFLDLISYTEGTQGNGYRTAFGGGRLNSLNDHPRYSKSFKQLNGKTNTTSAAGRYQFLKSTWDGVARQYGLRDFSPHSQDLGAIALLIGRGALAPLLKGDWQTAVRKSGKEWASLPTAPASYSQPTKSWAKVNQFMTGKAGGSPSQGYQSAPQERYQPPKRRLLSELIAENAPPPEPFRMPERRPLSELLAGDNPPEPFVLPERKPLTQLLAQQEQSQPDTVLQPTVDDSPIQQPFALPERRPLSELLAETNNIEQNNIVPELEPQGWQI